MSGEPVWIEESERTVLGSALLSPTALDRAIELDLAVGDFWPAAHNQIWSALRTLRDAGHDPDPGMVGDLLSQRGELRRCGGLPYLHDLISAERLPTTRNVTYHAERVIHAAQLRRMVQAGIRITHLAESGAAGADMPAVLEYVRREVEDATAERTAGNGTAIPVSDSIWPFVDHLSDPVEGVVSTPWPELDELLNGGLLPGELVMLCAQSGVGKTIAGLEMAKGAAQSGIPTTFVTCEMSRSKVLARLVASTATVPLTALIRHQVQPDDMIRAKRAAEQIAEWPLVIDEAPGPSAAQIRSSCRSLRRTGLGLVVVDQLSFLQAADRRAALRNSYGQISRDLAALAKELGCPLVLIHQLNRNPSGRAEGRPSFRADANESSEPGHAADKVLLLWRREDRPGRVTVIVDKHRDGPTGEVELGFEGRYARIVSAHSQWQ